MIGVEDMELLHREYLSKAFIWPLFYLLVAIFLLVLIYFLVTNKIKTFNVKYKFLVYILLVIMSFGLFYDSIPTIKYGIYLLVENESSVMNSSGVITSIEDAYNSPRYYYEGNNNIRAKIITIDDKDFYIYNIGDFEVGDNVTIEYMPKSTFILRIDYE